MLSLFKKKPVADATLTLKTRVEKFWTWYTDVAPRFYETIEAKKCADLASEVSARVRDLFPGFAWLFGPGENKVGHSFTLSGEGNIHHQLVTQYWLSRAPTLAGWTFHASRQPGPIKGHIIEIGGNKFDPMEFWIAPSLDREQEKIDIVAWHPKFDVLEERQRSTVLFLFLDELLGEYGTDQCIGHIEMGTQQLADAVPLTELLEFVEQTKASEGWKKYPPGQSGIVYKCPEQHDRFMRGDVVVGSSTNWPLIRDYLDANGDLKDPLVRTGADYVFISFDVSILPKGDESGARGEIEEALETALEAAESGRALGGAHGTRNAYIDLMIYDGTKSLEIVKKVLREKVLPRGTEILFFAKEKRGHRIVL